MADIVPAVLQELYRGCIGAASALQACDINKGPYTDLPEEAPNTTCFRTEAEAREQGCTDEEKAFLFREDGKMGR